jgi:hypothetical protein
MDEEKVLTADEAHNLRPEERVEGLRVKGLFRKAGGDVEPWHKDVGPVPPFGGRWSFDPDTQELALAAAPTEHKDEPRKEPAEKK